MGEYGAFSVPGNSGAPCWLASGHFIGMIHSGDAKKEVTDAEVQNFRDHTNVTPRGVIFQSTKEAKLIMRAIKTSYVRGRSPRRQKTTSSSSTLDQAASRAFVGIVGHVVGCAIVDPFRSTARIASRSRLCENEPPASTEISRSRSHRQGLPWQEES